MEYVVLDSSVRVIPAVLLIRLGPPLRVRFRFV